MAAKNLTILGIDTSCDDTAISVIEIRNSQFEIISNVISSQVKLHAEYGGVYPSLAKREHIKNLPVVFRRAVKGIDVRKIDYIAVTVGPGLEPCLWQGLNFARALAERLKKPLIAVNHIEAHIAANFIDRKSLFFPAICLVVSGGHTQLILMKKFGKYKLLGETRDDAAGECFDKTARILGLGYPGGPVIDKMAAAKIKNSKLKIVLPRPMMYTKNYDFSFSGLKTAVLYEEKKFKKLNLRIKTAFCREIQQAVIDVLIRKTVKAARDFRAKSIILGGGVAASRELRKQFKEKIDFFVPEKILCTDNGAMVAAAAYFHRNEKADLRKLKADGNLKIC